ncbi:GbsR/MarR family transcriptional regulator [Streptomyces sp. NPDC058812]|uniref:GbsR/MarR family transcriptional regulator n=1 Tax=unclassified Streptomyces TaxID=2593676 RepID=UPI00368A4508
MEHNETETELRAIAEKLALALSEGGMQKTMARVMTALLFTQQKTMTAGDLCEELQISSGAVSGAVKQLILTNMIERVPAPGSRRDHYRFRENAWATLLGNQNAVFTIMMEAASEGLKIAELNSPAGHRLDEMQDFYSFMHRELTALIEAWRERYEESRMARLS